MSKNIKLKKTETIVEKKYISKIGDIADSIKNITIEAVLNNFKKFELKDSIVVILDLEDDTGKINALLIFERDEESVEIVKNIIKNNYYRINGSITQINEEMLSEFDDLVGNSESIKNYITSNKILAVRGIEKISSSLKIDKIRLSYSMADKKLLDLDISFGGIKHFEINNITSTISHSTKGELLEFIDCGRLELIIYKNKLKESEINILLNSVIRLFSVGVFLENGKKDFYNLPYYSNEGSKNDLQFIYDDEDVVRIIVDKVAKYKEI